MSKRSKKSQVEIVNESPISAGSQEGNVTVLEEVHVVEHTLPEGELTENKIEEIESVVQSDPTMTLSGTAAPEMTLPEVKKVEHIASDITGDGLRTYVCDRCNRGLMMGQAGKRYRGMVLGLECYRAAKHLEENSVTEYNDEEFKRRVKEQRLNAHRELTLEGMRRMLQKRTQASSEGVTV